MKRTNLREKGITLIALVVTVIILLILAGVTVSLVVGENGLLGRAQQASNTMANATANEIKMMDEYDEQIGELTEKQYAPGLYDETTMEMKKSWDELIQEDVIKEENGVVSEGSNTDRVNILDGQIIFPKNITEIGDFAFSGCNGLTGNLILGNSVEDIKDGAFYGCSGLTGDLIIPYSVTRIGRASFQNCIGLTGDIIIPNSVTEISSAPFNGCGGNNGIKSLKIDMATVPMQIATGLKFKALTLGNNVKTISSGAFAGCELNGNLIILDGVTTIGAGAFSSCSGITGELKIPNSVSIIEPAAFYNCTGLNKITISDNVSSIGNNAFANVSHIYYTGTATGSPWGALAIN